MSRIRRSVPVSISLLWCLSALFGGSAAAAQALKIGFEPGGVAVSGVTAKGRAVVFGVAREVGDDDYVTLRTSAEILEDLDGDGKVTLDLEAPLAKESTWVAVDTTKCDSDAGAPTGFRLRQVNLRGRGVFKRDDGRGAVEEMRGFVEALVVRCGTGPDAGAWIASLGDGGPDDEDGAPDGKLELALDRMVPLSDSPEPPDDFSKDDVVVLIDPNALEMALVKVGGVQ